jgi:ABC-2 type transport system ATP-binding protein
MSVAVEALEVRFGRVVALSAVSATFPAGAVSAVIGGDGAGKTTLLRALVGALEPNAGRVERPARTRIGFAPVTSGVYGDLTVEENLAFVASVYGLARADWRPRVLDLLEHTGLAERASRRADELSGGMRQKLSVIRAMIHRPDLLVLDEPTTGVDPVSRADLWWLVARAAAEGAVIVVSTTYLNEAERAAQVLLLDGGELVASGPPERIRAEVPGAVRTVTTRPDGEALARSWRRGRTWRLWSPDERPGPGDSADLADAVVVAMLARERVGR